MMMFYRALDPMILPTEASQIVKQRLLSFVRSLSTVLAFAYCLSRSVSPLLQCENFNMHCSYSTLCILWFRFKFSFSILSVLEVGVFNIIFVLPLYHDLFISLIPYFNSTVLV